MTLDDAFPLFTHVRIRLSLWARLAVLVRGRVSIRIRTSLVGERLVSESQTTILMPADWLRSKRMEAIDFPIFRDGLDGR